MFHPATHNRCSTELIYTVTKQTYSINIYMRLLKERKNVFRSFKIQIELSLKITVEQVHHNNGYKTTDQQIFNLFKVIIYHLSVL